MRIISRYLLKEHVGPFLFAATTLTSIMLLQFIARRFSDLVGKGLPWQMIAEFFVLSIPFTVAMTLPMAVLVAVLYAFSRLASENEITALRAGGVSSRRLLVPVLGAGIAMAVFMLLFNDQVLPRSNHQLATLQLDIFRAKPTFALREQVINTIKEGQLYLSAERLDEGSARMRGVTIYDLADPSRRRTIYADSGYLQFARNQKDLEMVLYDGVMQSSPTQDPSELTRLFFGRNRMVILGVGSGQVTTTNADTTQKGDREMSVCEMQRQLTRYSADEQRAGFAYDLARWRLAKAQNKTTAPQPKPQFIGPAGGIGAVYCDLVRFLVRHNPLQPAAAGAEVVTRPAVRTPATQQPAKQQPATQQPATQQPAMQQPATQRPAGLPPVRPAPVATAQGVGQGAAQRPAMVPPAQQPGAAQRPVALPMPPLQRTTGQAPHPPSVGQTVAADTTPGAAISGQTVEPNAGVPAAGAVLDESIAESQAHAQFEDARAQRNRFEVEIQKKFSLAAACIVFVLVGGPVALRFPRGGVGLVIGVSFAIFALYYVGLIGGEALADRALLSPFWAMWAGNVVFGLVGLLGVAYMGRETNTNRGGSELWYNIKQRFSRRRRAAGEGASVRAEARV